MVVRRDNPIDRLAEREVKSFDACIKKFDLKLAINNRLLLTNQLIEPLLRNCAFALAVNIDPACSAGRLSIDRYAEVHGSPWR